jgi:3'(2'), 5'-bisphosphate nucleotidase
VSPGALDRELEVATRLAREAARVILEVYATPFDVVEKELGQGPVTLADHRANTLIVEGLRQAFATDSIIAEETIRRDETGSARSWFIDPLDGTREFVERNGMFAVHIGLAVDGRARLGVVLAPTSGKLYTGLTDEGAWLEEGGVRRRLEVDGAVDLAKLHLLVSRSHRSSRTGELMKRLGISRVTEQGSVGLKVGLIAEGLADLYLHPTPRSSRWDTCAPEAILRGAGGVLTDFAGEAYAYDGKELENVRGIFAGSGPVAAALLPVLRELTASGALPGPPNGSGVAPS